MEPNLLRHHGGLIALPKCWKPARERHVGYRRCVVAVLARPKDANIGTTVILEQTVYKDNWFDRLAIHHLSQSVQAVTGVRNDKEGYESLIEASSVVLKNYDAKKGQELVVESLKKALPKFILSTIRTILPPSKVSREYFAAFTTLFFPWLVGRCEVRESEFEGRRERNVVYIPKCRFLDSTNCVGMCTNLCKMSSQKFIQDSLGMPVHMVPNFEDMSCEMIFGQHPPADDPALKQPCYKSLCIARKTHQVNCSS